MRMRLIAVFLCVLSCSESTPIPTLSPSSANGIYPNGIINTVAGRYALETGSSGDQGPASSAKFNNIQALGKDIDGNVLIVDSNNNAVRKVSAAGIVTTIVGTLGSSNSQDGSGDNGPASLATLNNPRAVAMDTTGNLYISDDDNYAIRKVSIGTNIITTVVGQLNQQWSSNHPTTGAGIGLLLSNPFALCFGPDGSLYFSDNYAGNIAINFSCTLSNSFSPIVVFL